MGTDNLHQLPADLPVPVAGHTECDLWKRQEALMSMSTEHDWSVDPNDPDQTIHTPEAEFPTVCGFKTFFYPGCGVDWKPLHRFTHLCDTFVYCDMNADDGVFCDLTRRIESGIPNGVSLTVLGPWILRSNQVKTFADESEIEFAVPHVHSPWGKLFRLVRTVGAIKRNITLIYLKAEGVTLYTNLFNRRGTAPRIICLNASEDGFGGGNWTTFRLWDGPLGRAVWDNPVRPQILVVDDDWHPRYDWPWNRVWQRHVGWVGEGQSVTSYVLPTTMPAPAGLQTQHVRVHGEAERWLAQRENEREPLIIVEKPRHNERPLTNPLPVPPGERDFPGWNQSASLSDALQRLSGFVSELNAERVGWSGGVRFEDEGPALTAWKKTVTRPRRLTIHCQTEGDVYSFAPFADYVY